MLDSTDDVQVPRVYLTWRGAGGVLADEPALDIAAAILGDGKSSRLYKRLVFDEKIAQNVRAGFGGEELARHVRDRRDREAGHRSEAARAPRSPKRSRSSSTTAPDAGELERAINSHEAGFLDGLEPTLQRAIQLASYDVMAHDPDLLREGPRALSRGHRRTQVKGAAAKYLKPNARVRADDPPGQEADAGRAPGKDHK